MIDPVAIQGMSACATVGSVVLGYILTRRSNRKQSETSRVQLETSLGLRMDTVVEDVKEMRAELKDTKKTIFDRLDKHTEEIGYVRGRVNGGARAARAGDSL